jgi:murein DD-endopeptidase MepM/ murein hydrolase activator NlpD
MRRTWTFNGGLTAAGAALLLSACNMSGRPEPGATQEAAVATTEPAVPDTSAPIPGSIEYYAVAGDTVPGVAQRFGVTEQTLIEASGLQPPYELVPGERLLIPPRQEHVVAKGDTVYSIARRYGVSREELVRLNNIAAPDYKIKLGQHLMLPAPPAPPAKTAEAPQATVTSTDATAATEPGAASGAPLALQPTTHQGITAEELPPPPKTPAPPTAALPPAAADAPAASPVQPGAAEPVPLVVPAPRPAKPQTAATLAPATSTTVAAVEAAQPKPVATAAPAAEATAAAPATATPPQPAAASTPPPAPSETAAATPQPEAAPATPPAESGVETLTTAVAEPPPLTSDKFMWPVSAGKVVAGYGPGAGGQQNDGVNIAAPEGTEVRAAENGVVAYAGNELRGFGNLLLIRHADGWMTAYAHNDALLVKRGDTVRRGQIIARVGKTGNVSEPQLHFELRRGTRALDPVPYLGEGGSGITPAASPGGQQGPG